MRNLTLPPKESFRIFVFVFCLNLLAYTLPFYISEARGQDNHAAPLVQLISPPENQVTIHKKPRIYVAYATPVRAEELFVMLDGIDITQVLALNPKGFGYQPISVLEPGSHTLMISGQTTTGEPFNNEFVFSTRHYEAIEKADTHNELTVYSETSLYKSEGLQTLPDRKIEANLGSFSQLREKGFELSLAANLRYLEQDLDPTPPEEKGADLIDVLLKAAYTRGNLTTNAEIGDTEVILSENTLPSIRRRGGQIAFGSHMFKVGGFSVNSAQTYGSDDGLGVGNDEAENIVGGFGDIHLLDNRLSLRAAYSKGGEIGSSFGTTLEQEVPKEGNVIGAVVRTDFFEGQLVTEFEYDWSEFDGNTTDTMESEADKSYRFLIEGGIDRYTYGAAYTYFGPNYEVIGNQNLEKDREGFCLNGGAGFEKHGLSLTYSRYEDNVEADPALPVILTHTGSIDYSYYGLESVPISLSYQKEIAESSDDPAGTDPIDRQIDMVSGTVTYIVNAWNFGFQSSYAKEDDSTDWDADTSTTTYSFMPQYVSEVLIVSPNFSVNQSKDHATGVSTDSRTITADLQGKLFDEKMTCSLGGTLDFTDTSDEIIDQRTLVYFYTLNYTIGRSIWGYVTPVLGLRGEYNEIEDRITDQETKEYLIMLTLSINVPFSF